MAARVLLVERSGARCARRLVALGCATVGVRTLLRRVSSCVRRLVALGGAVFGARPLLRRTRRLATLGVTV